MKNQINIIICFFAIFTNSFTSYAQNKNANLAKLTLELNHVVGNKPLKLQDESYINEDG